MNNELKSIEFNLGNRIIEIACGESLRDFKYNFINTYVNSNISLSEILIESKSYKRIYNNYFTTSYANNNSFEIQCMIKRKQLDKISYTYILNNKEEKIKLTDSILLKRLNQDYTKLIYVNDYQLGIFNNATIQLIQPFDEDKDCRLVLKFNKLGDI